MQIKEIDYGIGFCVESKGYKWVELHKNLKKYPILYDKVLKHEKLHYNTYGLWDNIYIDLIDSFDFVKHFQLFGFTMRNPKTLIQFMPVVRNNKGGWVINITAIWQGGLAIILFIIVMGWIL